jgi:predicted ATP-dependent endonuclease of OLD family
MFIKSLTIKNFRCFGDNSNPLKFKVPDGVNEGSGLNIFVGENGMGKTATLEIINYLTESHFSIENRLTIFDFYNGVNEITAEAIFDKNFSYKMPETYRGQFFECNGLSFSVSQRNAKSPGKLLSPPITVSTKVLNIDQNYKNSEGKEGSLIEEYHKIFDERKLGEELNIFYFDKNRNRQITSGMFKTTFDRIIDDLNWKFLKALKDNQENKNTVMKSAHDYFTKIMEITQKGTGGKISNETKEFFNRDDYEKIKMDFMNILWPFSNAFFALREENGSNQIPVAKLGSGIEMIFTLLLLRSISDLSKGSIIYLIDEPELHLHPQAQNRLFILLKEISKDKQVFISTHSPYFIESPLIYNIFKFENNDGVIKQTSCSDYGLTNAQKDLLNLDIKEIFFAKKVLCVEGKTDINRFTKYFKDFGDWTIVKMNSKHEAKKFHKILKAFSIQFKILLDLDALEGKQVSKKDGNVSETNTFKNFLDDVQKEIIALGKTSREELLDVKLSKDEKKKKKSIIITLSKENIFILSWGEIEDYLDEEGNIIGDNQTEKKKELDTLLN